MSKLVAMSLLLFSLLLPSFSEAGAIDNLQGTMSGRVYVDEKPVPYAVVAFFSIKQGLPPVGMGVMRLPDFVGRADGEGKFETRLSGGQYYVGILPRAEDEPAGPPKRGENFYFANDDHNRLRTLSIENGQGVDVGHVNGAKRPEILLGDESEDYFTVDGTVIDGDSNKPYFGARVLAKKTPDHGKPDFFGSPTGRDGKFSLKLPAGTPLFLFAREEITGLKPHPGDKMGTYGINTPLGTSISSIAAGTKGPPSAVIKDSLSAGNVDKDLAIMGTKGQMMSGLIIYMYAVPGRQESRESSQKQSDVVSIEGVLK